MVWALRIIEFRIESGACRPNPALSLIVIDEEFIVRRL